MVMLVFCIVMHVLILLMCIYECLSYELTCIPMDDVMNMVIDLKATRFGSIFYEIVKIEFISVHCFHN